MLQLTRIWVTFSLGRGSLAMVCNDARLQLATRPIARVSMPGKVDASSAILNSVSLLQHSWTHAES